VNKTTREIYLQLASEVDFTMCSFCEFYKAVSGYSPCDCGEPNCTHPLGDRFDFNYEYGIEPNMDCWGFRPSHDIAFCADIVGIMLRNKWESVVWWQNKKGQWRIAELKE